MPPSPRLLHSKFEFSLRSVCGAEVTALNIMSNMKQFSIMVVVVGFVIRLIGNFPMGRTVRVTVGVRVAVRVRTQDKGRHKKTSECKTRQGMIR